MQWLASFLVAAVAILHLYILVLEMFLWTKPQGRRAFGMTQEQACELLENLWLKTFTVNKIRSWSHTRFSAGSPLYQNVTVGGQTVDGRDAVAGDGVVGLVERIRPQEQLGMLRARHVSGTHCR